MGAFTWGWYPEGNKWVKLRVDEDGSFHVVGYVDELNDIGDVNVPAPGDDEVLYWDAAASKWQSKANWVAAHKDTHDPQDGADPLDTAAPGSINANANAVGVAHSFARSDHNHQHTAALHQAGGGAEINVTGLPGVLAAPQTPLGHHTLHELGNADEIVNPLNAGALPALTTNKIWKGVANRPAEANPYADADAVAAIKADGNFPLLTLTFIIDGGGSAIAIGQKGHLEIPFACTITGWTILADQSGSIVVDVWKDTYAAFPPVVGDSIAGTEKPTISAAQKGQDLTLTTWTTAIAAGDILAFNVDSCATITRVTISLKVEKS